MRRLHDTPPHTESCAKLRCNHPLAFVIDATEREISELEQMLANCPNCNRWSPGNGPIMAIVTNRQRLQDRGSKKLV